MRQPTLAITTGVGRLAAIAELAACPTSVDAVSSPPPLPDRNTITCGTCCICLCST